MTVLVIHDDCRLTGAELKSRNGMATLTVTIAGPVVALGFLAETVDKGMREQEPVVVDAPSRGRRAARKGGRSAEPKLIGGSTTRGLPYYPEED